MITHFQSAFSFLLLSLILFNSTNAGLTPSSCETSVEPRVSGAIARFFQYDPSDTVHYNDIDFISGGYFDNPFLSSYSGIWDLTWNPDPEGITTPYGNPAVPPHYFFMAVTGYYVAPQSGIYNFEVDVGNSTGMALFMGDGTAFDCCGQFERYHATQPVITNAVNQSHIPREVYMETGLSYPFKLMFTNYGSADGLAVKITLPDGSVDNTVADSLWSSPRGTSDQCSGTNHTHVFTTQLNTVATTTVTHTTSDVTALTTVTSGLTSWTNDDYGDVTVVIVVEVPVPVPRTSYTTGPVDSATTISTITTVTTGTDGSTTPDTIIVIETPPPSTVTSYITGEVTKATTITTISTFTTGTDGNTTPEDIVVIETPPPHTVTSHLTDRVTKATTYTITTFTIGPDGHRVPEYIVVIVTPCSSTVTSHTSTSLTEETAITTVATITTINPTSDTSISTSYNSGSISVETTTPIMSTLTETGISASSDTITSPATGSITTETEITPMSTSCITNIPSPSNTITSDTNAYVTEQSSVTTVNTNGDTSSTPATSTLTNAPPGGVITSNIWESTSSSIKIYYGNSTSHTPSFHVTSQQVPAPSTPSTSSSFTQSQITSASTTASRDITQTVQYSEPTVSANAPASYTSDAVPPSTTQTYLGNEPNAPGSTAVSPETKQTGSSNEINSPPATRAGSSNEINSPPATRTGSGNKPILSADVPAVTLAPPENEHSTLVDDGNKSLAPTSAPVNEGASLHGNDGRDKNSNTDTGSTLNSFSSPAIVITPSLSAYEGAGVVNRKWSLTSLLAIIILLLV